jgi:hypothetical protein
MGCSDVGGKVLNLFIYLRVSSNHEYIALNKMVISECWIGKGLEERRRGLI